MKERKAGWLLQLFFKVFGFDAIVINGVARYAKEPDQHSLRIRLHEQCHILQQESEGIMFYPRYLLELITKGYSEISYELEAESYARIKAAEKSLYAKYYLMDDNEYLNHCYAENG